MFVWKRPKINEKEAGEGPFKKMYQPDLKIIAIKKSLQQCGQGL